MKKKQVVEFFGNQKATGKALGISQAAVAQWPEEVPATRQFQIEVITEGKLKAKRSVKAVK